MNRSRQKGHLVSDINITPFTDVILVLLIIFMVMTPLLSQPALNVELPKASSASTQSSNEKKEARITITKTGIVYLEGQHLSKEQLKQKINALKQKSAKISVILNVDQGAEFKSVVSVLDVLKTLGIRDFNIATASEK